MRKNQKKVVTIIQARMGSSRFPGKMLMYLGDRPILLWVIDRLRQVKCIEELVVATSYTTANDEIEQCCIEWGVPCTRGSENDVLERFVTTARSVDADFIVRVCGDNPLIDPYYVNVLVEEMKNSGDDYISYAMDDGRLVMQSGLSFFSEVMLRSCLERVNRKVSDQYLREHVTLGIYQQPFSYNVKLLKVPEFCNDQRLRFTIDIPQDLELLNQIVTAYGKGIENVSAKKIVTFVKKHPDWLDKMKELNRMNPKTMKSIGRKDD